MGADFRLNKGMLTALSLVSRNRQKPSPITLLEMNRPISKFWNPAGHSRNGYQPADALLGRVSPCTELKNLRATASNFAAGEDGLTFKGFKAAGEPP